MQNAHLRMGTLAFVRQTRDTITNVSVYLDRVVAEQPPDSKSATELHLVSVFGGDQEIGATLAAAHEGLRFQVRIGGSEFIGTLNGEDEQSVREVFKILAVLCETLVCASKLMRMMPGNELLEELRGDY